MPNPRLAVSRRKLTMIVLAIFTALVALSAAIEIQTLTFKSYDYISVQGLSLYATNCGVYPAPMPEGEIVVNSASPVTEVEVYVNGTLNGYVVGSPSPFSPTCTGTPGRKCSVLILGSGYNSGTYSTEYNTCATCVVPTNSTSCIGTYTGSGNTFTGAMAYEYKSGSVPCVAGDTYVFTFVATFQDGSTAAANATVVAYP